MICLCYNQCLKWGKKCTSVFILIFINPQYTVLHILSNCTSYSLFYFIICSYFHSHLYLYRYSLVLCFIVLLLFIFFVFYLLIIIFFCTFHWADLSWLTFHYWLYPVWLCMWQIIKNLEPWKVAVLIGKSLHFYSEKQNLEILLVQQFIVIYLLTTYIYLNMYVCAWLRACVYFTKTKGKL